MMADKSQSLIFIKPFSSTLEKLIDVFKKEEEQGNIKIYQIESLEELKQTLTSVQQSLVLASVPKKCAQFLQQNRKLIAKTGSKVILLNEKKLPNKTLDKFSKIGLTEYIQEPVPPRTLIYKVQLLLKSIKAIQEKGELNKKKANPQKEKQNTINDKRKDEKKKSGGAEDLYARKKVIKKEDISLDFTNKEKSATGEDPELTAEQEKKRRALENLNESSQEDSYDIDLTQTTKEEQSFSKLRANLEDDEVSPEMELRLGIDEATPEVKTNIKIDEVAPEIKANLAIDKVTPEMEVSLAVDEVSPEMKASLEIDEVAPEMKASLAIDEVAPEMKASLAIDEVAPEMKASLTIDEVAPEMKASLEIDEVAPEMKGSLAIDEVAPEMKGSLAIDDVAPEMKGSLAIDEVAPEMKGSLTLEELSARQKEKKVQEEQKVDFSFNISKKEILKSKKDQTAPQSLADLIELQLEKEAPPPERYDFSTMFEEKPTASSSKNEDTPIPTDITNKNSPPPSGPLNEDQKDEYSAEQLEKPDQLNDLPIDNFHEEAPLNINQFEEQSPFSRPKSHLSNKDILSKERPSFYAIDIITASLELYYGEKLINLESIAKFVSQELYKKANVYSTFFIKENNDFIEKYSSHRQDGQSEDWQLNQNKSINNWSMMKTSVWEDKTFSKKENELFYPFIYNDQLVAFMITSSFDTKVEFEMSKEIELSLSSIKGTFLNHCEGSQSIKEEKITNKIRDLLKIVSIKRAS